MQTADFDVKDFEHGQKSRMDETLLVKFFIQPLIDNSASKKEGRPIYRDREFIDIKVPGSRTGGDVHLVKPRDVARFPRHYDAFKRRIEAPNEGTPLHEWPLVSRSQAEEMAFYNVKTVEQLAEVNDNNAGQFMGMQDLKRKASEWLERAGETAQSDELYSELKKRDDEIDELKIMVADLKAMMPTPTIKAAVETSKLDGGETLVEPEQEAEQDELGQVEQPTPAPRRRKLRPRTEE